MRTENRSQRALSGNESITVAEITCGAEKNPDLDVGLS
jgi:hypothetical protein